MAKNMAYLVIPYCISTAHGKFHIIMWQCQSIPLHQKPLEEQVS